MKADYARARTGTAQVTVYRAKVDLVTHNADFSDSFEYIECDHNHTSRTQAEACAYRLGRKNAKEVI
jgi:hypothetical protein